MGVGRYPPGDAERPPLARGTLRPFADPDLLANVSDPCFIVTALGVIVLANHAAEVLTGYARDELVGSSIELVVARTSNGAPHGARIEHCGALLRCKRGDVVPVEILQCPTRDGLSTMVVRPEHRPRGYLRDDTIEGIVHDIKHPLATITLESDALELQLAENPRAHESLHRIEQNVLFIGRLVHDLLDANLIDEDQFSLRRRRVELRSLLVEAIRRVVASRDQYRVTLVAPEAVLLFVDEARIERVIANVLVHALGSSPPGSPIEVTLEVTAHRARVAVVDRAIAPSSSEASRLFDKHHRPAGSGIGLYLCRKILEAHGGKIYVEPIPGRGSRFVFELPRE